MARLVLDTGNSQNKCHDLVLDIGSLQNE